MQASDIPPKFPVPFADTASGSLIVYPIPTTPQTGGHASLDTGFTATNFTPVQSGGIPPWGADFNGLLKQETLWSQWFSAGAPITYDGTFQTAIGGYPAGAVIQSATTQGKFYFCLVDNNTTNPDTGGANWLAFYINNAYPPVGFSKLSGTAPGASKLASWTVSELVAAEVLGGRSWKGTGLTLSFNGAGTGAGGMDTGSMPTSSDLAIYAIYDPATNAWNTLGTIASISTAPPVYAGANMPAGYTSSSLIWVGKTTGTNFVAFLQTDRQIDVAGALVLSGQNSSAYTTVSVATVVPAAGRSCSGYAFTNATGSIGVSAALNGLGEKLISANASITGSFPLVPCPSQQLVWRTASNPAGSIFVTTYTF